MKKLFLAVLAIAVCLMAGCSNIKNLRAPLIVGSYRTVGIAVKANPELQQVEAEIGYVGGDVAIVPQVVVIDNNTNQIVSKIITYDKDGKITDVKTNAVSVLCNFGMDASAGMDTEAIVKTGMKNFLAVGNAADDLAAGFKAQLGK